MPSVSFAQSLRRFRWALVGGLGVVLILVAWAVLRSRALAQVTAQIERVSGHRTVVGGLSLGLRQVVARDVRIFGAPPFERETLAQIERLQVQLGGPRGFWSPADVLADGVTVDYLGTGAVDNVGLGREHAGGGETPGAARPRLRIRNGHLRGVIHPSSGPRLLLRARDFSLDVGAEGDRSVALEGVTVEVAALVTISIPELVVNSEPRGMTTVHGESASLIVPGGGVLAEELSVDATRSVARTEVTIAREPGPGKPRAVPRVRATLRLDDKGAQLAVDVQELSLRALHALLDRSGVGVDRTRADLHLLASMETGRTELPFETDLRVRGVDVRNPAIDTRDWKELAATFHANGSVELASRRISVEAGEVEALGARLAFKGWTELGAIPRGTWSVRSPTPLACGRLLPAQPAPVREALEGMKLAGTLGVVLSLSFDAAAWEALALDVAIDPLCEVAAEPKALADMLASLRSDTAPPVAALRIPMSRSDPHFAALASMPAHLPAAFLTAEDGRFFSHRGFDVEMIRRALAHDLEMQGFAKGGSTLTQQLAKNLFLTQSRTVARKLEETVLAWRLEALVDKRRLLELYLNMVELGPNIRGVKQAALAYFGKELKDLRPIESAHLAALTPNPNGLARRFRDGRVDDGWVQRLYDLLGMMNRSGRLSRAELAAARNEKLTLRKI